jgi:P4 family phage/plasmid primase-like protien
MEFTKVAECVEYCNSHNLAFFRRDLNDNFTKIFVADTYSNIFDKIKAGHNKYYESWSANQTMKFFIDYDKKIKNEQIESFTGGTAEEEQPSQIARLRAQQLGHKSDILNIINHVKTVLPKVTGVYILKSIPDTDKKSYHIIFEGLHFPNYRNMKVFVEEQIKPKFKELFDQKIIDTTVYAPKCFRSLLCTKFGQNRCLYLLETEPFMTELREVVISREDTTFEHFKKTCLTYIEGNSVLYTYKPTDKKKETNKKVHLINDGDIYSDKEITRKYLDILDPDRYTDRNKWLNVGYILYSINSDYGDLWHYFSSKWDNYNERDAAIAWDSFGNSEYIYTIHNLMHLAKTDNPADFNELCQEIPTHDIKYLRPFDNIISKLIYRLYGDQFVCSNPEKNEWYYFNGIRWVKENKSFNLRKLMINDVFTKVENYRRLLIKEGASEELVKNYHNILKILGSGNKLNCLELEFYNSNFYKIIDQNKDLIGFDNGVYDLTTMEFRKGIASDYISLTVGYEYMHYRPDSQEYVELYELICKIFPHEDVRHFTLKSLASCLDGHIRDENFYIYSGKNNTGGNGKSTIMDLLLKALGEYACVSPVSLVTTKRESANSANSALANIMNKRAVVMQEPESNEMIQAGVMKALTGGDRISTRELHSSQMEFKPHAKFFMCCNKIPTMSDIDGGVIRRLKITEFVSRFVEEPQEHHVREGIYEFKIDKDLKSKLDDYKSVFMSLLLDYYAIYRREGLTPPGPVLQVTQKYENDNNIIKQFIDENLVIGQKGDSIPKEQLKEMFRTDYTLKRTFGTFNVFASQLENGLCTEFQMDKKNTLRIYGWRIRQDEMESDNDCDGHVEALD